VFKTGDNSTFAIHDSTTPCVPRRQPANHPNNRKEASVQSFNRARGYHARSARRRRPSVG